MTEGGRRAAALAGVAGLLVPLLVDAQPSTSHLESSGRTRVEFAVNADIGFGHSSRSYDTDIRTHTSVLLGGIRKTYEARVGIRVAGVFISHRQSIDPDGLGASRRTSFNALGALMMLDIFLEPVRNMELGVHLGGGFAPYLHSESVEPGVPAAAYLNGSSTQQSLLGLAALRASWGALFIEQEFMLMDFGSAWTGEFDNPMRTLMVGVRLPLNRLKSR